MPDWLQVIINSTAFGYGVQPEEAFPKANEYVNKALKIDNTCPAVYNVLGVINTFYYWNCKEAEHNFKHSLKINPNRSLSHLYYSFLLTVTRHFEEAIFEIKRAQELDPLSAYINTYTARTLYYAGQPERALEEFRMTLTLNPNYHLAHSHLGIVYFGKSMLKEAVAEWEKAVDLSGGNSFATAYLIVGYYQNGKRDSADRLFKSLKKRSETEYVPATSFYMIHRFRGEEDQALEWLKRACKERDTFLPWLRVDSLFMPEGSKYMKLLIEAGLDY